MNLHPAFRQSFGGLTKAYYFRQFFFGAAMAAIIFELASKSPQGIRFGMAAFLIFNTLLYPYSRFVYKSTVEFITGRNVFFVNAIMMLIVKFMTMMLCFFLAIFIAPVGLAYLYIANRNA